MSVSKENLLHGCYATSFQRFVVTSGIQHWENWHEKTACFSGMHRYCDEIKFRAEPHSGLLREEVLGWIRPLLKYDWCIDNYDLDTLIFHWKFKGHKDPMVRTKMFSFATLVRYVSETPSSVRQFFEYIKFMPEDEAYLLCNQWSNNVASGSGHEFCVSLKPMIKLGGWTFKTFLDRIDTSRLDSIHHNLYVPPFFTGYTSHLVHGFLDNKIEFTPELYKLFLSLQPIDELKAKQFLKATKKGPLLKHEIIDFSNL